MPAKRFMIPERKPTPNKAIPYYDLISWQTLYSNKWNVKSYELPKKAKKKLK